MAITSSIMIDITSLPYRPCVGIALFNNEGKVFVGERIDTPGAWQMPQGGIDPNEDLMTAALRELKEEIGTDKAELLKVHEQKIRYDLPPHLMGEGHEGRVLWDGKYRGQEQTWVAFRFTGEDKDIALDGFEHPEFSQWKWIDLKETLEWIVPFKKETYRQVISAFSKISL